MAQVVPLKLMLNISDDKYHYFLMLPNCHLDHLQFSMSKNLVKFGFSSSMVTPNFILSYFISNFILQTILLQKSLIIFNEVKYCIYY